MDIEACPYCRENDAILREVIFVETPRRDYFVECQFCLARGPSDFNKSQALGAWNSISAFVFYFD